MDVSLSTEQLADLADLVAERLAERIAGQPGSGLISAAELANRLSRSRDYVYANADALGAIRIGDGERPRLMFPWPLRPREAPHKAKDPFVRPKQRRGAKRGRDRVELLPIRGQR